MRKLWGAIALVLGAVLVAKLRRHRADVMEGSSELTRAEQDHPKSEPQLWAQTPDEIPAAELDNVIEMTGSRSGTAIAPAEAHPEGTPPGLRAGSMTGESEKRRLDNERWRELRAEAHAKAPMGESLPADPDSELLTSRLNHASRQHLLAIYGIGPEVADRIIAGRPYRSGRELLESHAVTQTQYENLKQQLVRADELTA